MIRSTKYALAIVLLGTSATAGASAPGTGRLSWDCAREGAPTYQEIRSSFGIANFHHASEMRVRLHSTLRAQCQRGFERVVLVIREPSLTPAVLLASR